MVGWWPVQLSCLDGLQELPEGFGSLLDCGLGWDTAGGCHVPILRQARDQRGGMVTLSMVFSIPRPFSLYLVFKSRVMGLPDEVTFCSNWVISLKAALSPYHWASYCFLP